MITLGSMLSMLGTTPDATGGILPAWTRIEGVDTILAEKHDTPLVTVAVVVNVGSYEDPKDKSGVANLFGDLLLRGTKNRSREQIEDELDFLGASLGAESGFHTTKIAGQVLSKNLDRFMALLGEILFEPAFPEAELTKLKKETDAQLHLRLEDDAELARLYYYKTVFAGHPYGRDPTGTLESIKAITREDILHFYRSYFHRKNTLLGFAGDITAERRATVSKALLARMPESGASPTKVVFKRKVEGRKVLLIDKPERSQTQFFIGQPAIDANDPDAVPLDVFVTAFGGRMFQAQYMQEIRVKRGWAYGAYADADSRRDGGSFYLYTYPAVKDTIPALKLSLELFEKAVNGMGIKDEEIDFAKSYLTRSFPFIIDTPDKVLMQRIRDRSLGRPDDFLDHYVDEIRAVTPAKARAVAKKQLSTTEFDVILLCTAKDFVDTIGKELGATSVEVVPFDRLK